MKQNRILLCAPKSGSGKTMITCGIITLLKKKGLNVSAFKCGPDYIDPMFHRQVLGVPSGNLDTYFTEAETLNYLLKKKAEKADITVIEGVMGYYDGLGGVLTDASAYDVARVTSTPVILVIDGKGSSLSLTAIVKGFKEYKKDSQIKGVILNRTNGMIYSRLKEIIEKETGVKALGYVPEIKDLEVPSRHLGLVAPEEIRSFQTWSETLAEAMGDTLDIDGIIALSETAPEVEGKEPEIPTLSYSVDEPKVKIGVAFDAAFSFYYTENFELAEQMGAEIIRFSPLEDKTIPEGISALVFGGGYPENYGAELAANQEMRESIRNAVRDGMPCIAECGGFMYLGKTLEDENGRKHEMTGILSGEGFPTHKLGRFGYIEAKILKDGLLGCAGESIRGHEFHYWDSTENGQGFHAEKPVGSRGWDCIFHTDTLEAGFPHFYFYNNPKLLYRFLQKAKEYHDGRRAVK
ncbi:MAG: cobyrinate a,c-diamide synthase [Parasporobacterium sp.]|nr:cobyrinate a,c-diamide synthase [Parasporobacterium sp.]